MKSIPLIFVTVALAVFSGYSFPLVQDEGNIEYSVQILSSKKHFEASDKRFKGVKDINEEVFNGIHKYTTGKVKNYSEAVDLMTKMQSTGFKDAFVVRYKDGQRAPVEKSATGENQTPIVKEEPVKQETAKPKPAPEQAAAKPAVNEEKQTGNQSGKKDKPVVGSTMTQVQPEFKGGQDSLTSFIFKNIHLPAQRIAKPADGQVMLGFTIDYTGKIMNARVISSGGKELDTEALRLIHLMPDWTPGTIGGNASSMEVLLPIDFYRPH